MVIHIFVTMHPRISLTFRWCATTRFKLYLRPKHMKLSTDEELPPLPLNKTAEQVFGDVLQYLYKCTQEYIEETHANGVRLWQSLKTTTDFVLSHPNGWEGTQQAQMRSAAVYAGLVPSSPEGHSRIHFVTEGEASIHYCIANDFASDMIKVSVLRLAFNCSNVGRGRVGKVSLLSMLEEAPST